LGFLSAFAVVGIANATTYNWSYDFEDQPIIGQGTSYTFYVPITDPAFVVPPDHINAATLTITVDYGLILTKETVTVQSMVVDNQVLLGWGDNTTHYQIAALLTPWAPPNPGQFSVMITNNYCTGGMLLDSASFHMDYDPVPEPATLFLYGGGLLALAAFRERFRKA
jgi:hypothetical protein